MFKDLLEEGGCYLIEDIETSYWLAGELYGNPMRFGLFCRWSTIEALKLAIDYANRRFISDEDLNLIEYSMMLAGLTPEAAQLIETIAFGQNCAFAIKAKSDDESYATKPYIYSSYTKRS